jgi:hypothetical protein
MTLETDFRCRPALVERLGHRPEPLGYVCAAARDEGLDGAHGDTLLGFRHAACSFGWWLMAGAGLF